MKGIKKISYIRPREDSMGMISVQLRRSIIGLRGEDWCGKRFDLWLSPESAEKLADELLVRVRAIREEHG